MWFSQQDGDELCKRAARLIVLLVIILYLLQHLTNLSRQMVSAGHTGSRCDLNMDLQMTEFLIPNCFRLNVSDGGSTDERSNYISSGL